MILLHDPQSKESREFFVKHRTEFEKILTYPTCLKSYPNITKFPAVVINIPEYIRDNSLWYNIKTLPNYKRLGMTVKDFQIINHASQEGCGQNSGVDYMDAYIRDNNLSDDYKQFLVDLCNDLRIPACFAWHGVSANWVYDLGEECQNDIHEINKTRCISYSPTVKVLETIPEHYDIIYPDTFNDITEFKNKLNIKIKQMEDRDAVYKGK